MNLDSLKAKVRQLPKSPGVYRFYDAAGNIIYVGKAKNLRNRVSSYFQKNLDRYKTVLLMRNVSNFDYIAVKTEIDAFLLENTLIKKYQPKYNIQLKDDKSYPWIVIKNEPFPRVFYTRELVKDGSEYYGPYTSVTMVRSMIEMFRKLYKVRNCKLKLTTENIKAGKFKLCLEYHIGNCLAPCEGKQTEADYLQKIGQIRKILRGKVDVVIEELRKEMLAEAEKLNFERAEEIKHSIELLENYQSKSTVVNAAVGTLDVFSVSSSANYGYVNFLKVIDGKIVQSYSTEIKKRLDETDKEILQYAIIDIRQNIMRGVGAARQIIVPFEIELPYENVKIIVPKRGIKKELLDLSYNNLKFFIREKEKQRKQAAPERRSLELLEKVRNDLNLRELPVYIECFDNSNLQGTNAVSSCVVFKNGKPSKKDYRKFTVKTVEGPDDFATMREVVYRRYRRLLDEGKDLPQLIIIDGGKGQLSAALESLKKLGLENKIAIISIAKRLEEIFRPGDPFPLYLDKNSVTLRLIQHARDEAHRFGITFHRQKRNKSMIHSELQDVDGVGEKTVLKLLKHFGSLEQIKNATFEELSAVVGKARAKKIIDTLKK